MAISEFISSGNVCNCFSIVEKWAQMSGCWIRGVQGAGCEVDEVSPVANEQRQQQNNIKGRKLQQLAPNSMSIELKRIVLLFGVCLFVFLMVVVSGYKKKNNNNNTN